MDTIILQRPQLEKTATSAAGVIIAICLLVFQNSFISAKDTNNLIATNPSINYLQIQKNDIEKIFSENISSKYKNSKIVEVEKGVSHVRMIRFYNNKPVRINIVELSQGVNESLSIEPSIASNTLANRTKISQMAKRENAIVAINGGYFKPQTGVPLGTLMINKKIYTGPVYDRVAMGILENGYDMARIQLKANVETNIGGLKIDNINQPRMLSVHTIVYTADWGENSPPSPRYGKQINGEIFVDMTAQKLASVGGRNPRTAIGYTKDNHLIMLTADGREGSSIGLTLMELASLMKELGCVNAMNLDGGGSTVMYVNGQVVNRPAVQGGIPLSHTLIVKKIS